MKKRRMFLLLLLCCFLFVSACTKQREEKTVIPGPGTDSEGITYITVQATYEDMVFEEKITCTYKTDNYYDLSFGLEGRKIETFNVKRGDMVEKGQVLASLELGDIEAQLPDLEHALESSKLQLKQAQEQKEFELNAAYILYSYSNMEKQDKDALKKEQEQIEKLYNEQIEDLEDQVAINSARLQEGKDMVEKGILYAPVNGEVTYAAYGERGYWGTVAVDGYSKLSENVITISSLTDCYFASSGLKNAEFFKEGETYQIKISESGEYCYYSVTPVHMEEWESQGSMQFALTDETEMVNLGTTGELLLNMGEHKNVLCLPKTVIHTSDKETFVYVLEDGQRKMRIVEVGATANGKTEILSGLTQEDLVIVKQAITEPSTSTEPAADAGQKEGAGNEE